MVLVEVDECEFVDCDVEGTGNAWEDDSVTALEVEEVEPGGVEAEELEEEELGGEELDEELDAEGLIVLVLRLEVEATDEEPVGKLLDIVDVDAWAQLASRILRV